MFNFFCKILQHPKINPGSAPDYYTKASRKCKTHLINDTLRPSYRNFSKSKVRLKLACSLQEMKLDISFLCKTRC